MTLVLGAVLGAGLLLLLAPWLWPAGSTPRPAASDGRLTRLAEEAGLPRLRPRTIVAAVLSLGAVSGAAAWLFLGVPVLAIAAALASSALPLLWLRGRRIQLGRARRGLWPDVCDHLIAAVRAGMSLPDALSSLATSAPATLRPAFSAFTRDLASSGHFDASAQRLKIALADPVADRIVETLRMARQVGGTELTTVLRALATSVRADAALRGEVEARQSWIRGAAVLGVVAPWAILAMLSLRPEGARAYGSAEGIVVVVVGGLLSIVAYRLMVRIGRLPEPRRWFG